MTPARSRSSVGRPGLTGRPAEVAAWPHARSAFARLTLAARLSSTAIPALAVFALTVIAVVGLVALGGWTGTAQAELSAYLPKAKVKAGGQVFRVDVAELPQDQALGLGGRKALLPDEGMLFVYRDRGQPAFWMHGMLIPIDMLWIDNDQIVYIVHRAPPPAAGTPDAKLPLYEPPRPANFVLEIAAGRAEALGLKVGGRVEFDFSGR